MDNIENQKPCKSKTSQRPTITKKNNTIIILIMKKNNNNPTNTSIYEN